MLEQDASEVRLASVTPSTLNPTCQLHAISCSCAPRPASRGGRAIALIIIEVSGTLKSQGPSERNDITLYRKPYNLDLKP